MRSGWISLMVATAFALAPQLASADDAQVQEQLKQMQERLMLLEDKLTNTTDQLDAATEQVNQQKQAMSNAGLAVDAAGASGIDSFLQSLEIGGWVNISYWHNFNDPGNGEGCAAAGPGGSFSANTGNGNTAFGGACGTAAPGVFNPLNPDAQGFSFDQLWFELERPVSPEQRSGFRADITMGKVADLLDTGNGRSGRSGDIDDEIYIHQANIQYLWDAPKVGDVKLTLGKFSTLIGYEVAQAPYNYNVSRSTLWATFQPVDHLGFLMSRTVDRRFHFLGSEGVVDWDLGVVNGFRVDDPEKNHGKTFTGRLRMTGENWSVAVAAITGAEFGGSESDKVTVADVIFTWDPFTDLNLWMNFDRAWENQDGADADGWGISVGGHYTVTERVGVTMRVDFAQTERPAASGTNGPDFGPFFTLSPNSPVPTNNVVAGLRRAAGFDEEALSITGTLHYQLSDQIKVRGELRWDYYERYCRRLRFPRAAGGGAPSNQTACTDSIFNEDTRNPLGFVRGGDSDQLTAGVDVIYEF